MSVTPKEYATGFVLMVRLFGLLAASFGIIDGGREQGHERVNRQEWLLSFRSKGAPLRSAISSACILSRG